SELVRMKRHSTFYEVFLHPERAVSLPLREGAVPRCLTTILRLEVGTAYPLLLRLFDAHGAGRLADNDLWEYLLMVESFMIRRAVCAWPTNSYSRLFRQWAGSFPEDQVIEWLRAQLLSGSGNRGWPTDEETRQAWLNRPQYQARSLRHILIRLEEHHGHKEAP